MRDTLREMHRALRDPRARILVAAAVLVLAVLLSWHLVAMGIHGMAMMLGLCLAIPVAAGVLLFPGRPVLELGPSSPLAPIEPSKVRRIEPIGRHPPDDGIRLRH